MFRTLFMTITAFTLMTFPAYAVDINDEGEAQLRTIFSDLIEDQKTAFNTETEELKVEGDIVIEQAEDYYAVTLPKLTYLTEDKKQIALGFISVNAVPTESVDNWKMSVTMPSAIHFINKDGEKEAEITLGKQKMQGVWNTDLNSFSKFKAQYNDIIIDDQKKKGRGVIDEFQMMGELKEKDGKWSGPSKAIIQGFRIEKDGQSYLSIEDIRTNIQLVDYNSQNRKIMLQKMKEANAQNKEIDPSEIMELYGSDYTMSVNINNINGDLPASKNRKKPVKFSMQDASFKMQSESVEDNKINHQLQFGYDDLAASDMGEYVPSKLNFELSLAGLPAKEIFNMASSMNISRNNPNSAKVAALQGMMTLPQILSKAQTTLKIKDTGFSNDNYKVDMGGDFKATPSSPFGVIGDMKLNISGLDKIVENLESEKEGADPSKVSKINSTLKNIQAIQLFSEKKENTDLLHLTMDEDGKILINGKDISLLMGQR